MKHSGMTFDDVAEQTVLTSNPAAGVLSVDVKTFTGRGRVSAVDCSVLCDATVGNRNLQVVHVSGANAYNIAMGAAATATQTAYVHARLGWSFTPASSGYAAMAAVDFAPGDILRVVVSGGQAGDDMSAIQYSFKEVF